MPVSFAAMSRRGRPAARAPAAVRARIKMRRAGTSTRLVEALEVLHEVAPLARGELQAEAAVVVVDHSAERLVAAIVVEAALGPRPQAAQRRRAVGVGR